METKCKGECATGRGLPCSAVSDLVNLYHCTRDKGHTGPHVACGVDEEHDICVWPNENDKVKE